CGARLPPTRMRPDPIEPAHPKIIKRAPRILGIGAAAMRIIQLAGPMRFRVSLLLSLILSYSPHRGETHRAARRWRATLGRPLKIQLLRAYICSRELPGGDLSDLFVFKRLCSMEGTAIGWLFIIDKRVSSHGNPELDDHGHHNSRRTTFHHITKLA